MAGGKETPRQKMIGMMYLVLTALLALNVSKSILDAFVSLEENIQQANIVQVDRGNSFYKDVVQELSSTNQNEEPEKYKKLQYVIGQMDLINQETEEMIKFIDQLKLDILNEASEDISSYKSKDPEVILWDERDGVKPARMNLEAVVGMDKYDEPMSVMGIADDIKKPTGKGLELWNKLNAYRSKIVELTATYKLPGATKGFELKTDAINEYKNNAELITKVNAMIDKSKANVKDDKQVLVDLYTMLTKPIYQDVHDVEDVHWIGKTFDHAPLVAGIAALSSLEQDILSARAVALDNYKSKVTVGEYSFNSIMPLAYGPQVVNKGDSVTLRVMMAAFDSDNQPDVTMEGVDGARIVQKDGQAFITFKAGSGQMDLNGTVSIKKKSGTKKTENWSHSVVVMEPSGSIELPQMNVLYRGFKNEVLATASGFDQTDISVTNATKTRNGDGWFVVPDRGATTNITVVGKSTATGRSVNLKTTTFKVKKLPKPTLYLGGKESGDNVSTNSGLIVAKYDESITLNVPFSVQSWKLYASSLNVPKSGSGSNIASAMTIIRGMRPGQTVTLICQVRYPNGTTERVEGVWIR